MAGMVGMVEATVITGMAMVFLGMVIITAIAIISSLITAAGNGAPTARSMSATPAIDLRRRKEARPGREARASFFRCHDDHRDRLPGDGNQSRRKFVRRPIVCAVSAPLERICPGFAFNARRTELAKEAPSSGCDKLDM
jgi:hypothetical protein